MRDDAQERVEADRRRFVEGKMSVQETEAYLSALERESVEIADREVELRVKAAESRVVELEAQVAELEREMREIVDDVGKVADSALERMLLSGVFRDPPQPRDRRAS